MVPFTQLNSKAEYEACVKVATGKAVLVAFWPGDITSNTVISALQTYFPKSSYTQFQIVDIYCFDVYALPELATELDVTFVPTLMWFMDGVMDAIVWHQGVAVQGESVEKGVGRVVDRIKGAEIGESDDDSDW
ncbi:hypothetical protein BKA66DRAFT_404755 [Pyrenochaeta sp. MPI-SDFR-AT-0127]|nr:hypothetical protein BKA66DRAFT_404755 [Pyrenochaeta sp. MPI-SDFR-AT-0127]